MKRLIPSVIVFFSVGLSLLQAQPISEGNLYRERSFPEVYVIHSGKKVWIPNSGALFAMGYDWSRVTEVPDGALDGYPRFNIPSSSPTPGSLLFPPNRTSHFPLTGIANATTAFSQGKEIQFVELYGWLRGVEDAADGCGDGDDFHYYLELDTEWALSQGIDLNRILRVGNVANAAIILPGYSPRRAVSLPLIQVELNSWGWHGQAPPGNQKPADWTARVDCGGTWKEWPFDPYQPNASRPRLNAFDWGINQRGPYVRIAGSLVTDSPHDVQHRIGTILSRYFGISPTAAFEWEGSVPDWHPGVGSNTPDHFARWTEIHPPDLIEVLDWKEPLVTTRAVALAARVAATPGPIFPSCEQVEFDIFPEAQRPTNSHIAYNELRGPETYFPWGENADNGSWITVSNDHIHVRAQVCGGAIFGSPGRFKAIYRAWWALGSPPPPPPPPLCPTGQRCCEPEDGGCRLCVPRRMLCP
jgi:hypothetical protein